MITVEIEITAAEANIVLPKYSSLQNYKEKLQFEAKVDTFCHFDYKSRHDLSGRNQFKEFVLCQAYSPTLFRRFTSTEGRR